MRTWIWLVIGLLSVPVTAMAQSEPARPVVSDESLDADPNTTRLFFAPTGRSLKRGEVSVGVYEVVLPFVQVGITDRISIGGGTLAVFGDWQQPFWVTPKLQVVRRKSTAASIGVLHFFNLGDSSTGIAYGSVTQGSADSAVTVGTGYAYSRSEANDHGAAVVMVGGEHRVSRRLKLVTENYVFKGGGFVSGGVRFFGEKLSADFGMVVPLVGEELFAFPMVNVSRRF